MRLRTFCLVGFWACLFSVPCRAQTGSTPDTNRVAIEFPDLAKLTEGKDYIIIDPAKDFKAVPCSEKGAFTACSMNIPACDQLTFPLCSNQTWNTILFNKLRRASKTMKYILLKPGDYRPLHSFYYYGNHPGPSCVSVLYYNPSLKGNPFLPPNDGNPRSQVVLEGIMLYSSNWLFHGLVIDGVTLSDPQTKKRRGQSIILGEGSDNNVIARCVVQHATYGIRIRNSNNNTVQDCEIRDIADPCSDAPALYITSENKKPARNNRFLHNVVYNYTDGFQSGREQKDGGADVGGTVLYRNWFFTEPEKMIRKNGKEYMPYENAVDIKLGGSSATDRFWLIDNYTWGWKSGDPSKTGCPTDVVGKAITIHRQARHITVSGNMIWNSVIGLSLVGELEDVIVKNNRISRIHATGEENKNLAIQVGSAINVTLSTSTGIVIENNEILDADKPVSVIGPPFTVEERKHKVSNNEYNAAEVMVFETGTVQAAQRDKQRSLNKRSQKQAKDIVYPKPPIVYHKVRDYPYPLP